MVVIKGGECMRKSVPCMCINGMGAINDLLLSLSLGVSLFLLLSCFSESAINAFFSSHTSALNAVPIILTILSIFIFKTHSVLGIYCSHTPSCKLAELLSSHQLFLLPLYYFVPPLLSPIHKCRLTFYLF